MPEVDSSPEVTAVIGPESLVSPPFPVHGTQLSAGQLLAEGVASDVMKRPDVMTAYLGRAHA